MFSTRAISMTFSSLMVRMYAGIAFRPAICDARQRRSPAIIWKRLSATCLSVMGWMMPISLMLMASSCSDSSSNSRRGWLGFASIWSMAISLMVELPCVRTFSVEMRASRPRPSALYFLCTAIYLFLLMISFASIRWFLLPVESASYRITGKPWLGHSLSFTLRWMTVLKTSSWKWRFTSS